MSREGIGINIMEAALLVLIMMRMFSTIYSRMRGWREQLNGCLEGSLPRTRRVMLLRMHSLTNRLRKESWRCKGTYQGCVAAFICIACSGSELELTITSSSYGVRYYWAFALLFYRASSASTMMEARARDITLTCKGRVWIRHARRIALREYLTASVHFNLPRWWCCKGSE